MEGPRTERLHLRRWREDDLEAFLRLNQDPRVLEFLPGPWDRERCLTWMERANEAADRLRYAPWAAEVTSGPDAGAMIGFVGLIVPTFEAHFTPCVEIGWRLDMGYWGRGYATEAARAALARGFERGLDEIVAITVAENLRSIAVMERLGMERDHDGDFDHPLIEPGHRLRRCVLHRLAAPDRAR